MLLAGVAVLLGTGCRVDVAVGVEVGRDGTGQVTASVLLDQAAAAHLVEGAERPRVGDLEAAGWRVEEPVARTGGGQELRAVKRFESPAGATRAVEELTGPGGPLRSFRLSQERSFLRTRTALTGTVDLSGGLDGFADPALREQLAAAGADFATIERQLGEPAVEAFHLEIRSELPGQARTWTPALGQVVDVRTSVESWNTSRIAFLVVAMASGLALVAVLVSRSRRVTWG
ncbi:MAG TPA: hypothetical protein VHE80_05935 [Acidimicrobiales bacterium]|nr:hypothetical protein [Acidimicrobiales bacterium]